VKFPSFKGFVKPRLKLLSRIDAMASKTKPKLPVMFSDTTDPYQPLEAKYKITRRCLQTLVKHGFPVLIVTKSDLVTRDIDILRKARTVVSLTITSLSETFSRLMEPHAPPPYRRLKALKRLAEAGIPTIARIDPIVPGLNDNPEDLEHLVKKLRDHGAKHVTASTLKPVKGFYRQLAKVNQTLAEKMAETYEDCSWIVGYCYLPVKRRLEIVKMVREYVIQEGLTFASCREGFPGLNTSICDGTAYIQGQSLLNL
jgi:DNA repair photolyase